MTGQDLLDRMELLNAELQLQSGEGDVTKGLLALNVAQDHFESLAAQRPKIFGSTTGTVATTNATETTTFPTGLLRIDSLWLLGDDSLPAYEIDPIQRAGGHRSIASWPFYSTSISSPGKPKRYWTNGRTIFWQPLPSGTHTVRWYGLQAASDISAGGTFSYDDIVALPLASFAVRLIKVGLDDQAQDILGIAEQAFKPVLDALARKDRSRPKGFFYTQVHET